MRLMKMKKTSVMTIAALVILICVSAAAAAGLRKITDISGGKGGISGDADTIYFGSYWQTYSGSGDVGVKESYNKEGIKWRVLANSEAGTENGRMLILSDKNLFAYRQHSNALWYDDWDTSFIRDILNSGKFIADAFAAAAEQNAIDITEEIYGDKIFLLELGDMWKYGFGSADAYAPCEQRKATATDLAQNVKMYECEYINGPYAWWLRSGAGDGRMHGVWVEGDCGSFSSDLSYGVRPALNLKHNSVVFLSAAEGGKSAVGEGDGFTLADYDGSKGWKLTLNDENLPKPEISSVTADNKQKKLLVTYSGVKTGDNMYFSAVLYDEKDSPVNYAKAASAATESGGTAEIPLSGLAAGIYPVRFFCEYVNGDKQTDTSSALSDAYAVVISADGKIEVSKENSSSSNGCNAGFGALALLALSVLAYTKTKNRKNR